jgi:hypothetical protein
MRYGDHERMAGAQDPMDLAQHPSAVVDVDQCVIGDDQRR